MIPSWLTILLVVAALAVGLIGNRWWASHHAMAEDDGFEITDLVGPVTTLATILLAFTLVQSLSSYNRAREDIGTEARVVDAMAESAGRLNDRDAAARIQQELVCYGRAVRFQEWDTDGHQSPDVSVWSSRIEDELATLKRQDGDDELDRLIGLDIQRGNARLARITETTPSIPTGFSWLMLSAVLISVMGLGLFVQRSSRQRAVQIAVLVVFTLLLGGTLFTINDLDQPFVGLDRLKPTEIGHIVQGVEADLLVDAPQSVRPCDDEGVLDTESARVAAPNRYRR